MGDAGHHFLVLFRFSGVCNLNELEQERTHRKTIELEDDAGVIDVFITITGTTPLQEATNDGESSANVVLETMPSRLTSEDIEHYVSVLFDSST